MSPRILMVLESWALGGTERYVSSLCKYLHDHDAADVSLAILGNSEPAATDKVRSFVRNIYSMKTASQSHRVFWHQIFANGEFDLAHLHLYTSLLPASLQLRGRLPRVATFHMPLTAWNWRHRQGWRLSALLADRVTGVSRYVVDSIGRSARDAEVISGHVPPSAYSWHSCRRSSGTESYRIVGIGRLDRVKRWETLIEAIALLKHRDGSPVHCRIVGGGNHEPILNSLIGNQKVDDRVTLVGPLPHEQIRDELLGADVFVLPSRSEGLPIAALESMSLGVPTVTSDFPSAREIIDHGRTGHRFPIGDAARLAELIGWHRDHPQESAAMGQRGRAAVLERFSEENTIARYAEIYASLFQSSHQEVRQ